MFSSLGDHRDRFFWGHAGRYVFNLTRSPLDTSRLRNRPYVLTVTAADVCTNQASLRESIRIRNR